MNRAGIQLVGTPLLGWIPLVITIVLFAAFVLASKAGVTSSSLTPQDLTALRFGVAGILLLPTFAKQRLNGVGLWRALALAATGGLGFVSLAYAAFAYTPANHGSTILHGSLPLMALILQRVFLKSHVPWRRLVAVLIIVLGIATTLSDSLRTHP